MAAQDTDFKIRLAAFAFLDEQRQIHGLIQWFLRVPRQA